MLTERSIVRERCSVKRARERITVWKIINLRLTFDGNKYCLRNFQDKDEVSYEIYGWRNSKKI